MRFRAAGGAGKGPTLEQGHRVNRTASEEVLGSARMELLQGGWWCVVGFGMPGMGCLCGQAF